VIGATNMGERDAIDRVPPPSVKLFSERSPAAGTGAKPGPRSSATTLKALSCGGKNRLLADDLPEAPQDPVAVGGGYRGGFGDH
jgi:hypothetical protein